MLADEWVDLQITGKEEIVQIGDLLVSQDKEYKGDFREDGLVFSDKNGRRLASIYSSYGVASIMLIRDWILLKTGRGRGTSARTESIYVYTKKWEEIASLTASKYVSSSDPGDRYPLKVDFTPVITLNKDHHLIIQMKNNENTISTLDLPPDMP